MLIKLNITKLEGKHTAQSYVHKRYNYRVLAKDGVMYKDFSPVVDASCLVTWRGRYQPCPLYVPLLD